MSDNRKLSSLILLTACHPSQNTLLWYWLSFMMEWARQRQWSERCQKGQKMLPVHILMGGHVSVCLFTCLSDLERKLNTFWWNERILMKFSRRVELHTSKFWTGVSDQSASRLQPRAQNKLFLENLSLTLLVQLIFFPSQLSLGPLL